MAHKALQARRIALAIVVMAGAGIEQALARMASALDRIEAAASRPAPTSEPADESELQSRHDRLREAVGESLRQLDELLAGQRP